MRLEANSRIHLTRWAVTALAGSHGRQDHHPGLPGPRRPQPAGDANVRRCWGHGLILLCISIGSLLYAHVAISSNPRGPYYDVFAAHMDGAQVVPPTTSRGTGTIMCRFPTDEDDDPRWCTFEFSYDSLSSPVTGAYLMTGSVGANGAILDTLAAGFFADDSGIWIYVPLDKLYLVYDDLWYAVITTTAYPLGEIRGHFVNETTPEVLRISWGRMRYLYR